MPENNTEETKPGFLEFKKYKEHEWFRLLIGWLIVIIISYIVSHLIVNRDAGYEYARLDKEQLQQINRIYFDRTYSSEQRDNEDDTIPGNDKSSDTNGSSEIPLNSSLTDTRNQNINNINKVAGDTNNLRIKHERVIAYIQHQFNYKVDTSNQIPNVRAYLYSAPPLEAMGFLGTLRLKVKSYFWLVGPEVYFEIIFWSLFGVIASLLFNLGVVSRNRTTDVDNEQSVFDSSEIPYQVAKLWYAPLTTLAIVLGYNFFSDQNIADISSSKGVIVFAFVGGFYSSRLIAFLDRLKEVLLPHSSSAELPVQRPSAAIPIKNITIELQLNDDTIPAELSNEMVEIGFRDASVILQNDENGEIIRAEITGEDQSSTFKVASIMPGKYIIKTTWSKEVNDQPINLVAEQKEEIKNSDTTITIFLRKDENEG